jgi:hypothetical protein
VFDNRVLRRIFGPKTDKVTGEWRKLHNGKLHNLYSSPISLGRTNQVERSGQGMWHAWEMTENCTRFWWESLKERGKLRSLRH